MTRPKLDKWYPLKTRFKVVRAHISKDEEQDGRKQYRLIIEFPREQRTGWFPFELQLKIENGATNYWCNPFGEKELLDIIEAVQSIAIGQKHLNKLSVIRYKREQQQAKERWENFRSAKEQAP